MNRKEEGVYRGHQISQFFSVPDFTFSFLNSPKLTDNGKVGIGFQRPDNSKPNWLKNKLDKDKVKVGSKSFVPNQPRRNSRKAKSGWTKTQPRRDLSGPKMKSKLNRSHSNYAQTLTDTYTGKTVKIIQDNRYEPADVSNIWYLDKGCARHMTGNRKLLSDVTPHKGAKIVFGDNAYGNTVGKGKLIHGNDLCGSAAFPTSSIRVPRVMLSIQKRYIPTASKVDNDKQIPQLLLIVLSSCSTIVVLQQAQELAVVITSRNNRNPVAT
ncbi:hypothetical protein F511_18706 [Dorcoceras hygrometricum]|uniref:Retrovirus-related Pol polyprotein from transposon TNT 1-94-like beta-barrel domain-containing protein n=1 Tax=Dorcoceras hygrometricum TaxID=472368 RepID=A0A2Z7BNZ4_9LAMI|nr:hypothetical protein F511_18706 [Dorcoceras hygrometricum]